MNISQLAIPVVVGLVIAFALARRAPVYRDFVSGAEEGLKTAVRIMPQLVALITAIKMFEASGAMNYVTRALAPLAALFDFPGEVLPFALLRPVSGSGSLAMATEIFAEKGPDSMAGRIASVMMGSTETTFYVMAVYFGAVGVQNSGYALRCGLVADFVSLVMSVVVCRLFFG